MPTPEGEGGPIILLTGGSGYVGGRLIPLLEQRGREPSGVWPETRRSCGPVCGPRPRSCVGTSSTDPRWTGRCGASTPPTTSST